MQKGVTVWFTGLSGAGKTTIALEVEKILARKGLRVALLDGDLVREYLTRDLGFSRADRDENIRRNSFVAKMLTDSGTITLCSFISPYRQARKEARELIGSFVEVYVNTPLEVCESRDVKGLYARARQGEIAAFTGISDPYEAPLQPEIEINTAREEVAGSVHKIITYLKDFGYIAPGIADLHLHTSASDGALDPREVVCEAKEAGYEAISITDHDTTAGLDEALAVGAELEIEVIRGIELSALEGDKEIHILGYHIEPGCPLLQKTLKRIIDSRLSRAVRMIEKLNRLGVNITYEQVKSIAGGAFVGRPHIARAMLDCGYIRELKGAFTADYIGRGGRAYVERFQITPAEAIELVMQAGGIPILAHPGCLSDGSSLNEDDISRYIDLGLKGLEVYYSKHTLQQAEYYKGIAAKYMLLITGGSDWHGQNDSLPGSVRLPYHYVLALRQAVQLH